MGQRSSSTGNVAGNPRKASKVAMEPNNDLNTPDEPMMASPPSTIRSTSYMSHRRSTTSLTSLFRKRRWKKRRGSISASFSFNDNDMKVEFLNVNSATEDELMTLPGVNRTLAKNIINHRQVIGGFRKVEDLALVSGMGATKLDVIRPEICISKRNPLSRSSSKTPSMESIPSMVESSTTTSRPRPLKIINLNTASIFDLMTVNGINQAFAARIITYRDRKGPFKSVDELKNVGMSYKRLGAIRMHLTTEDFETEKLSSRSTTANVSRNPSQLSTKSHTKRLANGKPRSVDEINGNEITKFNESLPTEVQDLRAIYELMSVKTSRPRRSSNFNFTHNCLPAYRVATWNLDCLTSAKINNPGVLEVITRTILENGFSIVAVQEVCDQKALDKICRELNEPTLPKNREWRGHRGNWKGLLHSNSLNYKNETNYLGILYDASKIQEVLIHKSDAFTPFQNGSLWQFAVFQVKVQHSTWMLINVLSAAVDKGNNNSNVHVQSLNNQGDVMEAVKSLVAKTDGALIMGYFNAQHAQKGLVNLKELECLHPETANDNSAATPCSLWATSELKCFLTSERGTVEDGLHHIAIPNGWSWNGRATSSGPLWCTMFNVPKTVFDPDLVDKIVGNSFNETQTDTSQDA